VPAQRRDLASTLRNALGALDEPGTRPGRTARARSGAADDAELSRLRAQLRAHPCHDCPDREDHARWAERWARLKKEHDQLVRRVEGRTGSIARVFDRICDVLVTLGYLAPARVADDPTAPLEEVLAAQDPGDDAAAGDGTGAPAGSVRAGLRVTRDGQWLRRLYAENDLLLAECLRRGVWDGLDAPALAAVVSTCVYAGRREEHGEPDVPGGPQGRLARALEATVRVWSEVDDLEDEHDIDATAQLDEGLVSAVHRWAVGRNLDAVLRGSEIAAGDFVRWCKQVIDVLDQIAGAAPTPELRRTAVQAIDRLRRGVVAYSSV